MVSAPETTTTAVGSRWQRRLTWLSWLLIAPFAIWAVARLFGLESGFPTVQLIAFTPYVALLSLVPLATALLTKKIWPAVGALLVTLTLAACVLPRWIADSDAGVEDGPTLRVMSVNLLFGEADPKYVADLVRSKSVDLLALQEFTPEFDTAGLRELLPNAVTYPAPGPGGSAILSRLPLVDKGFRQLVGGFVQAKADVRVEGAAAVYVESVHPCAPSDADRDECWVADLAAQPPATPNGPVNILVGDFNATYDHAAFRDVLAKGYHDAADVAGAGLEPSWPYDERWFIPGVTLDHILTDQRVGVRKVAVHRIPGSDHKAVFAELVLPKAGS